jgi:exoribonuclease-2
VVAGSVQVSPSTIVPTRRLTYDLADEMLAECSAGEEPALHALAAAAAARRRWRAAAGAVEIQMPGAQVEVADAAEDAPAVRVCAEDTAASASRALVAEMMILAGEAAARAGAALGVALPFRGQPAPALPSDEEMAAVPAGPCRMALLRACMTRSVTAADAPLRHAGLGLEAYAQVTSPIRRYGDLLAHWQLKAALRGDAPPFAAPALASVLAEGAVTAARVGRLERDAQAYWVAHYFRGRVASDPGATWQATFLGWFKQEAGLGRVLLDGLGLESIVKVGRPAAAGAPLRVRCTSADPLLGMYRLEEVEGGWGGGGGSGGSGGAEPALGAAAAAAAAAAG